MIHLHADGSEDPRPRTPEEIRAIEEANRIAARMNLRVADRRKYDFSFPVKSVKIDGVGFQFFRAGNNRRTPGNDPRGVVSIFERDMLMGAH